MRLIASLPSTWVDDGLSGFPDSVMGWDISAAGTGHDAYYCTRIWPRGWMDAEHRDEGDAKIGEWIWVLLPFGVRTVGLAVAQAVHYFGGINAYDSCGLRPRGASAGQLAAGQCRHGVPRPEWMK